MTAEPADPDDGIPTAGLSSSHQVVEVIRSLQSLILKHPVAAKAIFQGLIAEGEAFAATPEGREQLARLRGSELLHRAQLVLDYPGLSILEKGRPEMLPSTYIDSLFMFAANSTDSDLLDGLFQWKDPHEGA